MPAAEGSGLIIDVVTRHVPEAALQTDVGAELTLRLPDSAAPQFEGLLTEIDRRLSELGLNSYGLQMVTLEEVFLCVASGELAKLERKTSGKSTKFLLEV